MPVDGEIWHYTNASGLIGILEENVLWAGSAAFMNDRHEILTGREEWTTALEPELERLEGDQLRYFRDIGHLLVSDEPSSVFVASACCEGNNLTMWRNYGGDEAGFSIELDPGTPLKMRRQRRIEDVVERFDEERSGKERERLVAEAQGAMHSFWGRGLEWGDVIYNPDERRQAVEYGLNVMREQFRLLLEEKLNSIDAIESIVRFEQRLQCFKNESFKDEQERRVVCAIPHPLLKRCYLKFRAGKYGVVPYIELCVPGHADTTTDSKAPEPVSRLPIMRVIVGPTPDPDAVKAGVEDLLGSCGYPDVPVEASQIPFRR